MKPALVLIDHGSRRAEANAVLDEVAEQVRRTDPERHVEIAHLELAPPTLADAVARCAAAGAQEVVVVPWFLAPGRHTTEDIPRLLREAGEAHPKLALRLTAPLGPDPKLVELALARADETS